MSRQVNNMLNELAKRWKKDILSAFLAMAGYRSAMKSLNEMGSITMQYGQKVICL